jgi:hypothetical protein
MPRITIPTRRFRIYQREDGRYVSLSDRPGDSALGVDFSLSQALGSATREATLASREGCRVVIQVQQPNQRWKTIDVVKAPGSRSTGHAKECPEHGVAALADSNSTHVDLFCDCHTWSEPRILSNGSSIAWPAGWTQAEADAWRVANGLAAPVPI